MKIRWVVFANRQTDRQTDRQTNITSFGGGNNRETVVCGQILRGILLSFITPRGKHIQSIHIIKKHTYIHTNIHTNVKTKLAKIIKDQDHNKKNPKVHKTNNAKLTELY